VKVRKLKRCPCCNRDMNTLDKKGHRWAVTITYEGAGPHVQVRCRCGIQTKKVHIRDRDTVYKIWNRRVAL